MKLNGDMTKVFQHGEGIRQNEAVVVYREHDQ
jgi:hypothetical protein